MKAKTYEISFLGNVSLQRLCAVFIATLVLSWSAAANAGVVSDWNKTAESILVTKSEPAGLYYALVHLAIYDAVNAIERVHKHTVYAIHPTSPTDGASQRAAAAAAAYTILSQSFPDKAALLDQAYANSLASIPDGTSEQRGIAVGEEVAKGLLELRQNDGRSGVFGPYTFRYDPGDYMATPPAFSNPFAPALGKVKPFAMRGASQFRAPGPPDLTSNKYLGEFSEVKALGSATSTVRTPAQSETALFYFEAPATFWTRNYRTFIETQNLTTNDEARIYAMLGTAFADALIAGWDSKYYYNAWRPVSAIQNANIDGNLSTVADPSWVPFGGVTPPFPEYPSAHTCNTSAMNAVLGAFYGTRNIPMTLTSLIPGARPRHFDDLDQQNAEEIEARIWAGFHFRSANVAGVELGTKLGNYIANNYFLPVK